jgi:hypothetical protein
MFNIFKNLRNHMTVVILMSFTLGFGVCAGVTDFAIDFPKMKERIIELTKSAYLQGCVVQGKESDPTTHHYRDCYLKGEFYSADVRYILFQDVKAQ